MTDVEFFTDNSTISDIYLVDQAPIMNVPAVILSPRNMLMIQLSSGEYNLIVLGTHDKIVPHYD